MNTPPKPFTIEPLESRILLSADFWPAAMDGGQMADGDASLPETADLSAVPSLFCPDDPAVAPQRHEIVFVDSHIDSYQQLLDDLVSNLEGDRQIDVVLLDGNRDGIAQISEVLARHQNLDAVHLISHGGDSALQLGTGRLGQDTIEAYGEAIKGWETALSIEADLLIYGCNLTASENGQALADRLAELTGADVAASDDLTGSALLGGDWDLEYQTGLIETNIAVDQEVQQTWHHTLATETVLDQFSTNDDFNQNAGTQNWSGAWTEINAGNPDATINGGYFESARQGGMTSTTDYYREADLSGAGSATFSFEVKTTGATFGDKPGDNIVVYVSDNGGSSWTPLETIAASDITTPHTYGYDISSYVAANTQIRLQFNHDSGNISSDWVRIDNVQISYDLSGDTTAPAQVNNTGSSLAEGGTDTITNTELRYDDDLQAATDVVYTVTTAPTNGQLELTTDPGVAISDFTQDDIDNSRLVYIHDGSETNTDSFDFSVGDGQGNVLAGQSFAFTVTPVNDAPTATNLSVSETYTAGTPLDLTDIVVNDVDGDDLTVTLTLSDPGAGSLSTGTSGAVTSTFAGGVWTASGAVADVNTLLAGVTFTPTGGYTSDFTIDTSVDDGTAAPLVGSKDITYLAVNNAPTATNLSAAEAYTEDIALDLTDIVVGDVDGGSLTVTLTMSNPAAGTLSTGTSGAVTSIFDPATGVWTASGAIADLNTLLAGVTFTPTADYNGDFTIDTSVSDGIAAPLTGSKAISGTAVNDAPSATNLSAAEAYTEDIALDLTDIVVSDVDSGNLTVTLTLSDPGAGTLSTGTSGAVTSTFDPATGVWTASGAISDLNTLLAGVTFTPTADYNGSFTIDTSVSDGIAAPLTGSKVISGTPVNDAPSATNLSAAEAYTEDIALDLTDIVVSDVDGGSLTVTLTMSDPGAGTLSTGTSGAVTSTFDPATGVWTASGAISDLNTLLAGVTFTPTADYNGSFTIATSVSDGIAAPLTGSKVISGTPVNDAPSATNLSAAEAYTEDIALDLTDIGVSDVDGGSLTVTLTLSDPAAGTLSTGTSGAVTSTFAGGVWTASGAVVDVNTLLAGVTFTPTADYNGSFTIDTSVSDGIAAPLTGSKVISGTPVNDAPSATNLSAAEAYTEDIALDLTDIVVSDVDSGNLTVTLTLSDPAVGTLSTATSGAVTSTFDPATGVWTANGAISDLNTLLAGVIFTPSTGYTDDFTIATSVSDGIAAPLTGSKVISGVSILDDIGQEDITNPIDMSSQGPGLSAETGSTSMAQASDNEGETDQSSSADEPAPADTAQKSSAEPEDSDSRPAEADDDPFAGIRREDIYGLPDRGIISGRANAAPFAIVEMNLSQENNLDQQADSSLPSAESSLGFYSTDAEIAAAADRELQASISLTRTALDSIDSGYHSDINVKTLSAISLSFSVGAISWVLRGGSLLAGWLSTIPFWKGFDFLPILPLSKKERLKKIKEIRWAEEEEHRKYKKVTNLFDLYRKRRKTKQNTDKP